MPRAQLCFNPILQSCRTRCCPLKHETVIHFYPDQPYHLPGALQYQDELVDNQVCTISGATEVVILAPCIRVDLFMCGGTKAGDGITEATNPGGDKTRRTGLLACRMHCPIETSQCRLDLLDFASLPEPCSGLQSHAATKAL